MSPKTTYQDYYRYSWQVPNPPFNSKSFIKTRLVYIIPFSIGIFFLSDSLASKQTAIVKQEMRIFIGVIGLISLCIFLILDHYVSKSAERKASLFSISQQGISINTKLISFNRIAVSKIPDIKSLKKKQTYFTLKLPTKPLPITLKFNSHAEAEKLLKTIQKYTTNFPTQS